MIKKRGMLGIVFILSLLVLSGFVSAYSCEITERTYCEDVRAEVNVVLGLSDLTNAHGELYNEDSYDYVLCCDFPGTHENAFGNKVLGLSANTNAHAEGPSETTYGSGVYFGDLICAGATSTSSLIDQGYSIQMVSLSSETNAHLGEYDDYSYKILCGFDCERYDYNCMDVESCGEVLGSVVEDFACEDAGMVCCDQGGGTGIIQTCSEMGFNCIGFGETCSGVTYSAYPCPGIGEICCDPEGTPPPEETCEEAGGTCVLTCDGERINGYCPSNGICCNESSSGGTTGNCQDLGYQCTSSCVGTSMPLEGCPRDYICCSPLNPPTPGNQYWALPSSDWDPIESITINETYLSSSNPENTVGIISTEEEPGATYTIEIWEADTISGQMYDDAIRTVAQGNALTGTVNSYGNIEQTWTIYQSDITAGGSEDTSEFYFKITTQGETGTTTTAYRETQLDVTILSSSTPPFGDLTSYWENSAYNEITSIEIEAEYLNGNNPENLVYVYLSGVQLPAGSAGMPVDVEIWEKDSGEDDAIRTGANAISATVDPSGLVHVPWYISFDDINTAFDEGENEFEFYYVVKAQGYNYNPVKILDVTITGDPSQLANAYWTDWTENVIDTITFESENLGGAPDKDNTVYANTEYLNQFAGAQVVVEIWEFDSANADDEIRTVARGNALTGTIGADGVLTVPWTVGPYDILAAYDNSLDGDPYKFYFKVILGGQELVFSDAEDRLNMYITGENPPRPPEESLTGYWTDWYGENLTGPLTFYSTDLGGSASFKNSVKMHIDGWGEQWGGAVVVLQIYEEDSWLNGNDNIRTGDDAILGYVDSSGNLVATWTVTSDDIANAQNGDATGGDPFEFYFTAEIISWGMSFEDIFELYIDGEVTPTGDYLTYAQGEWRKAPLAIETITTLNFDPDKTNPQAVAFTWDIGESANGLTYYVEIWEKDGLLNADDEIRTVNLGNALTGTVANSQAGALWTITGDDIIAGGNEDISQFYYKIIIEDEDKTFSDKILEVHNRTYECVTINMCGDYADNGTCNADNCNVSDYTVETNYPEIDCSDPEINCYCYWDEENNGCEGRYSAIGGIPGGNGITIGYCDPQENSQEDNCDDGFLTYSWTATWYWGHSPYTSCEDCYPDDPNNCENYCVQSGVNEWYYDPNNVNAECQWGSNTIACPAQIQLPLGSWFNWVIALIIILVIYYLIINSKKKQKPKTKVKSKKK